MRHARQRCRINPGLGNAVANDGKERRAMGAVNTAMAWNSEATRQQTKPYWPPLTSASGIPLRFEAWARTKKTQKNKAEKPAGAKNKRTTRAHNGQ